MAGAKFSISLDGTDFHAEARAIYGCGVSSTRKVAGLFSEPMNVLCRNPDVGTQLIVAKNIGVPESMMIAPRCTSTNVEDTVLGSMIFRAPTPQDPGYAPPPDEIAFLTGSQVYLNRGALTPLAYQAPGQSQAYLVDSSPLLTDRRNLRDGHYRLWGYLHMIMTTSGGTPAAPASDLIGWINGTKPGTEATASPTEEGSPEIEASPTPDDDSQPEASPAPSPTPQARARQPARHVDEGGCSFEALATRTIPAGCLPCTSQSVCGCGSTCRRGFCE